MTIFYRDRDFEHRFVYVSMQSIVFQFYMRSGFSFYFYQTNTDDLPIGSMYRRKLSYFYISFNTLTHSQVKTSISGIENILIFFFFTYWGFTILSYERFHLCERSLIFTLRTHFHIQTHTHTHIFIYVFSRRRWLNVRGFLQVQRHE